MIFNFPQKKDIDVNNIKLYSSTNIKIESMVLLLLLLLYQYYYNFIISFFFFFFFLNV